MLEFKLVSAPPLAGYDQSFEGVTLRAPADLAIVSLALPLGGEAAAEKSVKPPMARPCLVSANRRFPRMAARGWSACRRMRPS